MRLDYTAEQEQLRDEIRATMEEVMTPERQAAVSERVEGGPAVRDCVRALAAADIVFLDPPRKGSDEATLAAVAEAGVPNLWYLSCNPATLARDLAFLAGHGYRLGAVQPFDMFPQTGHVETLVTLHRDDARAVTLPEREPTRWDDRLPVWPPPEVD